MDDSNSSSAPNSRWLPRIIPIWTVVLVLIYVIWGWHLVRSTHLQKLDAIERHSKRVAETDGAPSAAGTNAAEVRVGVYVDRISALSVKETGWSVDFYIWFLWKHPELNPGETFQIIEGDIESREKNTEHTMPDGTRYAM
jgi:hypothetical protein